MESLLDFVRAEDTRPTFTRRPFLDGRHAAPDQITRFFHVVVAVPYNGVHLLDRGNSFWRWWKEINCCGGSGRPSPFGVGGPWWSAGPTFHGSTLMVGWQLPNVAVVGSARLTVCLLFSSGLASEQFCVTSQVCVAKI